MKKIFILSSLIAVTLATPSFAEPTELDKKTVASKAYVDTKQDKITTGLVEFDDYGTTAAVPALVSTNAAGTALNGNTIGFLDSATYDGLNGNLGELPDTMVPSIGLLERELVDLYDSLSLKQNKLPAKSTGNAAPKGNQAVVLNTAGNPLNVYTTAGKDLALTAKSGAQKVMNYIDGTTASATFATSQGLTEAKVKSALVSLELLKDVYDVLNTKITNNALPTGTTGTVVTYNGTNAQTGVQEFTETAMTGAVTYTNGTLDNANDIATITAVGTRQKKKECGGYEPAAAGQPAHDGTHPGDEDYCWLWIFPED